MHTLYSNLHILLLKYTDISHPNYEIPQIWLFLKVFERNLLIFIFSGVIIIPETVNINQKQSISRPRGVHFAD